MSEIAGHGAQCMGVRIRHWVSERLYASIHMNLHEIRTVAPLQVCRDNWLSFWTVFVLPNIMAPVLNDVKLTLRVLISIVAQLSAYLHAPLSGIVI